jgi:predicted regulator of Ras-like GTPase activity (Roadblock/LC7/MglB family)
VDETLGELAAASGEPEEPAEPAAAESAEDEEDESPLAALERIRQATELVGRRASARREQYLSADDDAAEADDEDDEDDEPDEDDEEPTPLPAEGEEDRTPEQLHAQGLLSLTAINTFNADRLAELHTVSKSVANSIVCYRDRHGYFDSRFDLLRIPRMRPDLFKAITGLTLNKRESADVTRMAKLLELPLDRDPHPRDVVQAVTRTKFYEGCMVANNDGIVLVSDFREGHEDELGALAPQIFKSVRQYTDDLEVGDLDAMVLFFGSRPITVVHDGVIYLIALHEADTFSKKQSRFLSQVARGLGAMFPHEGELSALIRG